MATGIEWCTARGIDFPADGTGVFVVDLADGRRVLVKGSMNAAAELFGTLIAAACGVAVPRTRLVAWPGEEWHALKAGVLAAVTREGSLHARRVEHILNRTVLLVQDFVADAVPFYDTARFDTTSALLLRAVGRLVAVDVALNNSDRFPCAAIWGNAGNLGNALVRADGGDVALVAIDTLFVPTRLFDKRIAAFGDLAGCAEEYAASVWLFLRNCGFADRSDGPALVAEGLRSGVQAVREMCQRSSLAALKRLLATLVEEDWGDVWNSSLRALQDDHIAALDSALGARADGGHGVVESSPWRALYTTWDAFPPAGAVATELRVCLVQGPCRGGPQAVRDAVVSFIASDAHHRPPHLLMFAEGSATVTNAMRQVTAEYRDMLLVAGTYNATVRSPSGEEQPIHTQACELVMNGRTIAVHHKRFLHDGVVNFPTADGGALCTDIVPPLAGFVSRVAVCICRDVESRDIVASVASGRPQLLLNPCLISGESGVGAKQWRAAGFAAAAKFEHLAHRHRWIHLRCDWATGRGGMGCTMVIAPQSTIFASAPDASVMSALVPALAASTPPNNAARSFWGSRSPVERSAPHDNIGKWCTTVLHRGGMMDPGSYVWRVLSLCVCSARVVVVVAAPAGGGTLEVATVWAESGLAGPCVADALGETCSQLVAATASDPPVSSVRFCVAWTASLPRSRRVMCVALRGHTLCAAPCLAGSRGDAGRMSVQLRSSTSANQPKLEIVHASIATSPNDDSMNVVVILAPQRNDASDGGNDHILSYVVALTPSAGTATKRTLPFDVADCSDCHFERDRREAVMLLCDTDGSVWSLCCATLDVVRVPSLAAVREPAFTTSMASGLRTVLVCRSMQGASPELHLHFLELGSQVTGASTIGASQQIVGAIACTGTEKPDALAIKARLLIVDSATGAPSTLPIPPPIGACDAAVQIAAANHDFVVHAAIQPALQHCFSPGSDVAGAADFCRLCVARGTPGGFLFAAHQFASGRCPGSSVDLFA